MSGGYVPFLIADNRTGLDLSMDSWKTPADAFYSMQNCYQYRGVVYKRNGYSWLDSIPHTLPGITMMGNAAAYQNVSNITTAINATVTMAVAHGQTGTFQVRLTDVEGLTSPTGYPNINGVIYEATVTTTTEFTINNDFVFVGSYTSDTGTASYFPGLPCTAVGINYVDTSSGLSVTTVLACDTRRAAIYNIDNACLIPLGVADQFSGGYENQFWWENYQNNVFLTNNVDTMFYWNSGLNFYDGLSVFQPEYDGSNTVDACLMMKVLGSRFALFNTLEAGTRHAVRVRWCAVNGDPLDNDSWNDTTPQGGDSYDLLDSNYLISLVKTQSNVFLMSQGQPYTTIYEMRTVSDPRGAFVFVNVATSRSVNSTFSSLLMDDRVSMVGNLGLIVTDGNSMSRYDDKIPDFILQGIDQTSINLCYAQRYDTLWQAWTLFPSAGNSAGPVGSTVEADTVNDSVLIFNYMDNSWSFYTMIMAVMGLIDNSADDPTWASYNGFTNPLWSWQDFGDQTWASVFQKAAPVLIGGDYSGNIWYLDKGGGDAADQLVYLQGPNHGNSIDMTLTSKQWFPFAQQGLGAQFGFADLLITGDPTTVATITFTVDNEPEAYVTTQIDCIPFQNVLLAEIIEISQANPGSVLAEDHGLVTGQVVYIFGVQGMTQINNLPYTVTVINENQFTIGVDTTSFSSYVAGGWVYSQPFNESEFWTRIFAGQTGVFHQMTIEADGVDENFELHATLLWFKQTGRIYR